MFWTRISGKKEILVKLLLSLRSMRTMITDANTQQMLPAGNTNSMVLTGFGSNVAALARMLQIVDEASKIEPVIPLFDVIPLEYASADEIARVLAEKQAEPGGASTPISGDARGATGAGPGPG